MLRTSEVPSASYFELLRRLDKSRPLRPGRHLCLDRYLVIVGRNDQPPKCTVGSFPIHFSRVGSMSMTRAWHAEAQSCSCGPAKTRQRTRRGCVSSTEAARSSL